ncbi:MAG TPA: hypothetical protein V6C76_01720 [Drouetiella sp.]
MFRGENTETASNKSAIEECAESALYAGIQQPYDAVRQIAAKTVHISLPESNMFAAPKEAATGSAAWVAQSVGGAIGMAPWLMVSNQLVKFGGARTGLMTETAALAAPKIGVFEAGMTGATYGALFTPTQDNGSFLSNKLTDAGINFGTFAAGAALHNSFRPMFSGASSEVTQRIIGAGTGSMAGFGAGIANAELNNLAGREHQDVLGTGLKFGILGGIVSARAEATPQAKPVSASSFNGRLGLSLRDESTSLSTKIQPEDLRMNSSGSPHTDGRTGSTMFSKDFYVTPEVGRDNYGGPKPYQVEAKLPEVLRQYGENSAQHGFVLMDLGDALITARKPAEALQNYEKATTILNARGESTPRSAYVLDRTAHAKQAVGDLNGAQADLTQALEIWKANDLRTDGLVAENHIARRTEDLQRVERMIKNKNTRPPVPKVLADDTES